MILDVTCGSKKIYHGMNEDLGSEIVSMDIRKGDFTMPKDKNHWAEIKCVILPDVIADMQKLPFRDDVFNMIIFDPPHMDAGLNGWVGRLYGCWSQKEMIGILRMVNSEFPRVLNPNGFLTLKIMPNNFSFYEVLLKNFLFFLPIKTYRSRGSFSNPKHRRDSALWILGKVKN